MIEKDEKKVSFQEGGYFYHTFFPCGHRKGLPRQGKNVGDCFGRQNQSNIKVTREYRRLIFPLKRCSTYLFKPQNHWDTRLSFRQCAFFFILFHIEKTEHGLVEIIKEEYNVIIVFF